MAEHTFSLVPNSVVPKTVGYWVLYPQCKTGNIKFAMYYKPTDEQIKNTEQLLGWGWEDDIGEK